MISLWAFLRALLFGSAAIALGTWRFATNPGPPAVGAPTTPVAAVRQVHPNISSGREAVLYGDNFDSARDDVGIRISDDWGTRLAQTIDWTEWRIETRVPAVGPGIGAGRFGVSLVRLTRPPETLGNRRPLILRRLLLRRGNVEGGGSREWSRSWSSLETRSTFSARNLRLRPGETVATDMMVGL